MTPPTLTPTEKFFVISGLWVLGAGLWALIILWGVHCWTDFRDAWRDDDP